LFENVKGILQANKKSDWDTIQLSFSELGYNLNHSIIDAADFGTPQHRERLILVGLRDQTSFRFPSPTHGPSSNQNQPFVTPREAFKDIDDPSEKVTQYSGKYGHLLEDIPPGFNYLFYTERMGHPAPLFAWRSKFSGFLYKLDPEEPTKTLVAHQGKYDGPFHWRNRKLTIPELIRIQGYPSSYKFVGSRISIQKQIGNSVAPKMGRALAKAVAKQLFNSDCEVKLLEVGEVLKRKLTTRVAPNRSQRSKQKNDLYQLDMFPVATNWISSNRKIDIGLSIIDARCTLKSGLLKITARNTEKSKNEGVIRLELTFVAPVFDAFEKIICELDSSDPFDFCFAWDCIHKAVAQYTSYEDLSPLYGHFTEPYPKFLVKPSIDAISTIPLSFLKWISDYENLSKIHSRNYLENLFAGMFPFEDLSSFLRSKRIDIRINKTNRTIPVDHFRVCYPYTIPHWKPTFTTWNDAGLHRTADLRIEDLLNKKIK
jgi:DNA (cytosine-5)-methyltransferase 1